MTLTWSGAPDLPQVPFGRLFHRLDRAVPEGAEIVTAYTDGQVTLRSNRAKIGYHEAADLSSFKGVEVGDFVVHGLDILRGSVGIADSAGAITSVCTVCEPLVDLDLRYVAHVIRVQAESGFTRALARGIREGGADFRRWGTLAELPIPLPPVWYQRAVCNYLDRETARIDTLIEEQQRLIEMLRERRVATIAETLDGFEMTRLRRLVDSERPMTYGILQCGEPVDGGVPYIGPSDITGEGTSPERDALRTTTSEIASAYQRSVLAGGDVVVSIGPAYGKVAVVSDNLTGANLTQDTVRVALRPELVDTRFVVWTLLSRQTSEYWDYQIMGATFRRLNLGTLSRTPIPFPPIDVQRRIAHYLDEQTARIDTLIAEAERFIELSTERRSALITAAVTGQIDVQETA